MPRRAASTRCNCACRPAPPRPRRQRPPGWPSAIPTSIRAASAFSGGASRRRRASPRATAWRSTGRSRSIRRRRGGAARAGSASLAAAGFGDRPARALDVASPRLVAHELALARGVGGADARAALQQAQPRLGALAVLALALGVVGFFLRLLLRLGLLLLALAERGLGTERLLAIGRGGRRLRRARWRPEALRLRIGRRRIAVAHLAVLIDPLIGLREHADREGQRGREQQKSFHPVLNARTP